MEQFEKMNRNHSVCQIQISGKGKFTIVLQEELNPVIAKAYTEEFGQYEGVSRVVVRKFRVYYEIIESDIVGLAIRYPGEK